MQKTTSSNTHKYTTANKATCYLIKILKERSYLLSIIKEISLVVLNFFYIPTEKSNPIG